MEVEIIFWNFYSQPGFVLKEVEVVWAKGEKSEMNLCQKVVQKRSKNVKCGCCFVCLFLLGFFEKLLYGESLMLSLCRVKKITAEVMFALHINKSCEVESCYLVQECFDRLSDRRWTCTPICFHMWQLTETLRKQPKLEWNATENHLE